MEYSVKFVRMVSFISSVFYYFYFLVVNETSFVYAFRKRFLENSKHARMYINLNL